MALLQPGTRMAVLIDNETSCLNLTDYLKTLQTPVQRLDEAGMVRLEFVVPNTLPASAPREHHTAKPQSYAVVLKSNRMGMGDDQLGSILIRAFVNALPDADQLPAQVILYNSGVKLAQTGTDTALSLQKLHALGVEIVVCGTCVDYFDLKTQLAVGTISNMYRITALTTQAGHVVYP